MNSTDNSSPYGTWKSPLSPEMMGEQLRLSDVRWDSDGKTLVWLEGRSGRGVLVARMGDDAPCDLNDEANVRAGVGYGGGDFAVSHGAVVYADKNGRLYRQRLASGRPQPITPGFGFAASPRVSADGLRVLYVHTYENTDLLAVTPMDGTNWPVHVVTGADFYMQPAWHPGGDAIAWIEWDQPNMPWDGTRLMRASISDHSTISDKTLVAGGTDVPVFQPEFSPDGRWLAYITNDGEWDQLVIEDLSSGEDTVLVDGKTLAEPAWVQGIRVLGWMPDSGGICYHENDAGRGTLCRVDIASRRSEPLQAQPYSWFKQISVSPTDPIVASVCSSPSSPDRVVTFSGTHSVIQKRSSSERVPEHDYSTPEPLTWQASDGSAVHGLYYPPTNSGYTGEGLPPAIVGIHGGPTGQNVADYSSDVAFFTSRGYAFLDVNYRGSTGYGRSYMLALRERWGPSDTEDAATAAGALIEQRLADPDRIVIKGGSAGGFTVLNALIHHPGLFRAGLCLYGVTNLFSLASDTHKFEARYLDLMVGTLPEHGDRYQAWSPLFHAERIQDPVGIFQGTEDQVVPPDQAEAIVQVLQKSGVPHLYRCYEGEGHGWRQRDTIMSYYKDVENFLQQYVPV